MAGFDTPMKGDRVRTRGGLIGRITGRMLDHFTVDSGTCMAPNQQHVSADEIEEITQRVRSVSPARIRAERSQDWEEFHPERFCHECGTRNVRAWSAPSDKWNEVTRAEGVEPGVIWCPQCYTEAYSRHINPSAVFRIEDVNPPDITSTP